MESQRAVFQRAPSSENIFTVWVQWEPKDERTAAYFAAAVLASMVILSILYFIDRVLLIRYRDSPLSKAIASRATAYARKADRTWYPAGFAIRSTSLVAVTVYLAVNLVLVVYNRPWTAGLTLVGKRFGWLAVCNLVVAVFLGLKNTPLSPLAGKSFASLNAAHRCCGYTTIGLIILHVSIHLAGLVQLGLASTLYYNRYQYAATAAAVSAILIALTANGIVRKRNYEFFYVAHIILVTVVIIAAGYHTSNPYLAKTTKIPVIVAGSLFGLDKLFRFARLAYSAYGNYCIITPMPNQATRVTMRRNCRAPAGSNAFLWIPGIRAYQMHPFTIMGNEPVEFVIKAQDGFTRRLYDTACNYPGTRWRAAIEGPHGKVLRTGDYDKIVLLAGGSGATHSISLALGWLRSLKAGSNPKPLDFIFTAKDEAFFRAFGPELVELISSEFVNVHLHLSTKIDDGDLASLSSSLDDVTKSEVYSEQWISKIRQNGFDYGRPDVHKIVGNTVSTLTSDDRLLIAGCGPAMMIEDLRSTVSDYTSVSGPLIHFHAETFSM